ncbi:MAG: SUMF1/EgtB/PvdO family nonheme iron enzyme [Sphingomonadales bacterium]|jgi:formylglycine-generating enzyme required for sulfatase activity
MTINKNLWILLLSATLLNTAQSNNVSITNVSLRDQNPGSKFTRIKFDVSWDNSWRITAAPANWDAVWIFAKFRPRIGGEWKHCSLNWVDGTGTNDGHNVPSGAVISSAQDATGISRGVFMYASATTGGNVSYTDARLRWNYGADGIGDADSVEISVFAIEMVYVPESSFWVGGNATTTAPLYKSPTTTDPFQITSEDTIRCGQNAGNLRWITSTLQPTATLPAAFPKGFRAFYCMKYELTQDMWVAFLNHIPAAYATTRNVNPTYPRNNITVSSGVYSTSRPFVPVAGMPANELLSFLDWAALRPMTELEYEKACRGPVYPVAEEYAWGTALVATAAYTYSNLGNNNEAIATNYSTAANTGNAIIGAAVGSLGGPARSGITAAHGSNNGRLTSGATYYGIMEMTGNLYETVVNLETAIGRSYDGLNGDGVLNLSGLYNTANWGTCSDYRVKGGSFATPGTSVSNRISINNAGANPCLGYTFGIRGVRNAP